MKFIKDYQQLPQPVQVMVVNFLKGDVNEPEVYETTSDEYDHLAKTDQVVTQLLYWRAYHKFYAVLVGDAQRKVQSKHVIHDPYYKPCSILAFYEVDEAGIRLWNKKYKEKSLDRNILEFEE